MAELNPTQHRQLNGSVAESVYCNGPENRRGP